MKREGKLYNTQRAKAVQRFGNHLFDGVAHASESDERVLFFKLRRTLQTHGVNPTIEDVFEGLARAERNHMLLLGDYPESLRRANETIHRLLDLFMENPVEGGE